VNVYRFIEAEKAQQRNVKRASRAAGGLPGRLLRPPRRLPSARQLADDELTEHIRLFAALNGECLDQQPWPTPAAARHATVDYIAWYNGTRRHSALGYMTPDEFETATDQEVIKQVA
jgi:hypothetical protein